MPTAKHPTGRPAPGRSVWRRFARDRAGSATMLTAFASTALLGFMAVGIDGTHFYTTRRKLQAATDMAAIAAATTPASAAASAAAMMAANGFPDAALQVRTGTYVGDPALPAASRFSTAASSNAVEVVATAREAFIFGSAFQALIGPAMSADRNAAGPGGTAIRTRAVAQKRDYAALTLGSGLAALDAGLLNAVLGSLLGTKVSLSLVDYRALAAANLDLFGFSDALATRGLVTGPTYGAATASVISQSNLVSTLADAVGGNALAAAALRSTAIAIPPGIFQTLGKLVDYGPASGLRIGSDHPLSARASALDLLLALAELGADGHVAAVDLGATIPGLASTQLQLAIGEPAVGSSVFTVGPEGTTLHTAQVRLLLTTQIAGDGLPAALTVPVYVELAPASAAVQTIACAAGASDASVTLAVQPGLAEAWIGTLQPSALADRSASPTVGRATLVDLAGLVRIQGLGHASATAPTSMPLTYAAADIKAATVKTVSSAISSRALLDSLVDNTEVSVTALGLPIPQAQLPGAVRTALRASLAPLDAALSETLSLLGLSVGRASATVPGVRCGQGTLVN